MLQVARLSPKLLGESRDLCVDFLHTQIDPSGGFRDRAGSSDLYYTVFGTEALIALRADLPVSQLAAYLRAFGDGAALDFVHLTCLARCWAALPPPFRDEAPRAAILSRLESFRSADGGYDATPSAERGTIYGSFLALGAYQDLGAALPDSAALLRCVESLRAADGGYANQSDMPFGLTPPTAAAVTLLRQLEAPVPAGVSDWLLSRCHEEGGFFATPLAPIPDLLSTATALHALAGMHTPLQPIKEPCLDFLDTLWSSKGAFYGTWADDELDCEYAYYALLCLGHLSL
ncbi:MAG: prenyltransferase/squalene oxidase repeat-containing protein [Actinomycetota bacterium]